MQLQKPKINNTTFQGITLIDNPIGDVIDLLIYDEFKGFRYIVTPNIDHFQRLSNKHETEFIDSYANASYVICDSRIAQKLSLLLQPAIKNVVPGSDLTLRFLENPHAKKRKIGIIGPTQNDVDALKIKLGLENIVSYSPPMGFIKNKIEIKKCVDFVISEEPDFLFIAVGTPQGELLANRIKNEYTESSEKKIIGFCIGASIDFISGKSKRAPKILQRLHLEWAYRLTQDPYRLYPRYYSNIKWIISSIRRKITK